MIYLLHYKKMYQCLRNAFVIICCLAIVLCCYTPANCYVLQGPHLLDLMIKKYGDAKRLLVSQSLIFYDNTNQMGAVKINETLSYVFPEEFRSDILSENTQKIHVVSKTIFNRYLTFIRILSFIAAGYCSKKGLTCLGLMDQFQAWDVFTVK